MASNFTYEDHRVAADQLFRGVQQHEQLLPFISRHDVEEAVFVAGGNNEAAVDFLEALYNSRTKAQRYTRNTLLDRQFVNGAAATSVAGAGSSSAATADSHNQTSYNDLASSAAGKAHSDTSSSASGSETALSASSGNVGDSPNRTPTQRSILVTPTRAAAARGSPSSTSTSGNISKTVSFADGDEMSSSGGSLLEASAFRRELIPIRGNLVPSASLRGQDRTLTRDGNLGGLISRNGNHVDTPTRSLGCAGNLSSPPTLAASSSLGSFSDSHSSFSDPRQATHGRPFENREPLYHFHTCGSHGGSQTSTDSSGSLGDNLGTLTSLGDTQARGGLATSASYGSLPSSNSRGIFSRPCGLTRGGASFSRRPSTRGTSSPSMIPVLASPTRRTNPLWPTRLPSPVTPTQSRGGYLADVYNARNPRPRTSLNPTDPSFPEKLKSYIKHEVQGAVFEMVNGGRPPPYSALSPEASSSSDRSGHRRHGGLSPSREHRGGGSDGIYRWRSLCEDQTVGGGVGLHPRRAV